MGKGVFLESLHWQWKTLPSFQASANDVTRGSDKAYKRKVHPTKNNTASRPIMCQGMLNYANPLSSRSSHTQRWGYSVPIVLYEPTDVTDLVMSRRLTVSLALCSVSSSLQGITMLGDEWEDFWPYYVVNLIIAFDYSLMRQNCLDDDGIWPHFCNSIMSHPSLWRICL